MSQYELTPNEKLVFTASDGTGTTLPALAVMTRLSPSEARALVVSLSDKGLVKLADDQRVELTERGRRLSQLLRLGGKGSSMGGYFIFPLALIALAALIHEHLGIWFLVIIGAVMLLPLVWLSALMYRSRSSRPVHRLGDEIVIPPQKRRFEGLTDAMSEADIDRALDEQLRKLPQ